MISDAILFISAISLTFAAINLRIWFEDRRRWGVLAIASSCVFGAVYSWFELAMMQTLSPGPYGELFRWSHIPSWAMIVSIALFLHLELKIGRAWLLYAVVIVRTIGMIINFFFPVNVAFDQFIAVERISFLGEVVSVPVGVPNPWHLIPVASFLLLIALGIDGAVKTWKRGELRKAAFFGGGACLLGLSALTVAVSIVWFGVKIPAVASLTLMFVFVGFAIELDNDLKRSERLAEKVAKSEAELNNTVNQLNLSAAAASVGTWSLFISEGVISGSDKWRELLEIASVQPIAFKEYLRRIHPDDRAREEERLRSAADTGAEYFSEFRVLLPDGEVRWISSVGRVELADRRPAVIRGASVDISKRKLAEENVRALSRRLMVAQEKERARLARELHDGLSQSLALLSIQLQSLGQKPAEKGAIKRHVEDLTAQIQRLSSDVHRISHELHPSKLNQLGLEAALRGFCREIESAYGLKVGFDASNVPKALPNDISLCLYRVAQESLQNTVKHSGANLANVSLSVADGTIRLMVSDNGAGFDTEAVRSKEALGLVSMEERVRAVGGSITIESVIESGTRIEACASI